MSLLDDEHRLISDPIRTNINALNPTFYLRFLASIWPSNPMLSLQIPSLHPLGHKTAHHLPGLSPPARCGVRRLPVGPPQGSPFNPPPLSPPPYLSFLPKGPSVRWAPCYWAACSPAPIWGPPWSATLCGRRRRWPLSASSRHLSSFLVGLGDVGGALICVGAWVST